MSISEEIDEDGDAAPSALSRTEVAARVDEWQKRIASLFSEIKAWGQQNGWTADDSGSIGMHEEPMRRAGVQQVTLPVLRIDGPSGYALFKPKGLWVIGANGRVDLYTSAGAYVLVDRSEYGSASQWTIFRTSNKREGVPFVPELIASLV